eukprot:gene41428-21354_t
MSKEEGSHKRRLFLGLIVSLAVPEVGAQLNTSEPHVHDAPTRAIRIAEEGRRGAAPSPARLPSLSTAGCGRLPLSLGRAAPSRARERPLSSLQARPRSRMDDPDRICRALAPGLVYGSCSNPTSRHDGLCKSCFEKSSMALARGIPKETLRRDYELMSGNVALARAEGGQG